MEEKILTFIRNFNYFSEEEVAILATHTKARHFPKGTLLLKAGEVARYCYSVIEGCVREYYVVNGVEKTSGFYTEGEAVNAFTSTHEKEPSRFYFECAEDCILGVGTEEDVDNICRILPQMEKFMRVEVEKGSGILQDRLATFITSTPEQRLTLLLKQNPGLINRVPQHQIASYLGVTPESLSRIKKRMLLHERSTGS